jgi:hypothetical protein
VGPFVSYAFNVHKRSLNSWLVIAAALAFFGWGPLFAIILLTEVGLWPDPNPNPIGPGLLFFCTFWPAVICFTLGMLRRNRNAAKTGDQPDHAG